MATTTARFVRVHFPDPEPGTWPSDAEFRDRWEGAAGRVIAEVDDRVVVQFDGPPPVRHQFSAVELCRICGECGCPLDATSSACTWRYCPSV